MESKTRFIMLACILLLVAVLIMVIAYMLNVEVGYPVALALGLTGAVFWVNAE